MECDNCHRMFKDVRGLSVHKKRCRSDYTTTCRYCQLQLKTIYNLELHLTTCPEYKVFKIRQEVEENTKRQVMLLEEQYTRTLSLLEEKHNKEIHDHAHKVKELEEQYKRQIEKARGFHESQLKMREDDRRSIYEDYKKEELKNKEKEAYVIKLEAEIQDLKKKSDLYNMKMIQFAERATEKNGTTIYGNVSQVQNNTLQLQHFDGNMFRDKIQPPSRMVYSISNLVDHLHKFGIGNLYRCLDRSRNVIMWIDQDGTEIRDSNCSQLREKLLVVLDGDIRRQLAYQKEREARLEQNEELYTDELIGIRSNITFCRNLLDRDGKVMKDLQKELSARAKNKNDKTVDVPKIVGYTSFLTSLEQCLFPEILEWIELPLDKFGKWIGTRLHSVIEVEGGSFSNEKPFILIKNDESRKKITDADEFRDYVKLAYDKAMQGMSGSFVQYFLTKMDKSENECIKKMREWIEKGRHDDSLRVIKAIVATYR